MATPTLGVVSADFQLTTQDGLGRPVYVGASGTVRLTPAHPWYNATPVTEVTDPYTITLVDGVGETRVPEDDYTVECTVSSVVFPSFVIRVDSEHPVILADHIPAAVPVSGYTALMVPAGGSENQALVWVGDRPQWASPNRGPQGPKGDKGDKGYKGDKGDKGDTGPSNVLTVGEVSTGTPGSAAAVTITGDSPAQTLNFAIPQGLKGDKGDKGGTGAKGDTGPISTVNVKAARDLAITGAGTSASPLVIDSPYRWIGSGSPYGVVVPDKKGITYVDTAQTLGACTWVSTGTTNTSWMTTNGDTGMVSLAGLLNSGNFTTSEPQFCYIARNGRTVEISMSVSPTATIAAGAVVLATTSTLPSGLAPMITCPQRTLYLSVGSVPVGVLVYGYFNSISLRPTASWATGDILRFRMQYFASDKFWPTSLTLS